MRKPDNFQELLANWTTLELSADLNVPYVNARKMRERGSVSIVYWPTLIERARAKGIKVSIDDLVEMRRSQVAA